MSILVKPNTKVLVQGITGSFGARHAQLSIDYGSNIVAGVCSRRGGPVLPTVLGGKKVPIFDTVADAVKTIRGHRQRRIRSSALCRRCHPRERRCQAGTCRRHHRQASTVPRRHGPRETRPARQHRENPALIGPRLPEGRHSPAKARFSRRFAASASPPVTFTKKATSASSPTSGTVDL